jgi:PilZ domain
MDAKTQGSTVENIGTESRLSYQEKRHFIRMKVDTAISYMIEGRSELFDGRCLNLSGAGLLMETAKKINAGTKLRIQIPTEQMEHRLEVSAEVIRTLALPDQHKFEIGVAIRQFIA